MPNGGTYTEHLAKVLATLERLDERTLAAAKDRENARAERIAIRDDIECLTDVVANQASSIAVLSTRQKLIMGIGGVLSAGVLGEVIKGMFQ